MVFLESMKITQNVQIIHLFHNGVGKFLTHLLNPGTQHEHWIKESPNAFDHIPSLPTELDGIAVYNLTEGRLIKF